MDSDKVAREETCLKEVRISEGKGFQAWGAEQTGTRLLRNCKGLWEGMGGVKHEGKTEASEESCRFYEETL